MTAFAYAMVCAVTFFTGAVLCVTVGTNPTPKKLNFWVSA
jgi:hypothetical protein